MVRCRYVDSVSIQVSGPKSLLPQPIKQNGRLSMTWIHFLTGICGLQLEPTSDYFICNSTYTITSEGGWTANLNDTIKPFIDKFSRKRNTYCVRLHTGQVPDTDTDVDSSINDNAIPTSTPTIPDTPSNDTTQPWMSSTTLEGRPIPKLKTTPVKKFASTVPMKPSQWNSTSLQFPSNQSTSTSTNAVELPTPMCRVLIRGCPPGTSSSPQQSVTAAQLFQKPDGTGTGTPLKAPQRNPPSGSSIKKKNKFIPEFTIRIPSGRCINSIVSVPEPSPPKLSRFDAVGMSPPPAETQPGPSKPSTSKSTQSRRKTPRQSSSPLKRRHDEKDEVNGGSKNVNDSNNLIAIKKEIIEIDLASMEETDEEEEEDQRNGEALLQNERHILGILASLGDNGEDNDNATMRSHPPAEPGQIADVLSQIEMRLDGFEESTLQKIKIEIRQLMNNQKWERNAKRSPLACYLLQEMFKD